MSLYVSDDFIDEMKKYVFENYEALGELYIDYINSLKRVLEGGHIEGKTHNALEEFVKQIELSNTGDANMKIVGATYKETIGNYVLHLDKVDKDLY